MDTEEKINEYETRKAELDALIESMVGSETSFEKGDLVNVYFDPQIPTQGEVIEVLPASKICKVDFGPNIDGDNNAVTGVKTVSFEFIEKA